MTKEIDEVVERLTTMADRGGTLYPCLDIQRVLVAFKVERELRKELEAGCREYERREVALKDSVYDIFGE